MKMYGKLIFLFFLLVTLCNLVACDREEAELLFENEEITIMVGEETPLRLITKGNDLLLEWTSSKEDIASVIDGVIKGKCEGTSLITVFVKDTDIQACIKVIVEKKIEVMPTKVIITSVLDNIKVGNKAQLTANLLPTDASEQEILWSVDNGVFAKISSDGLLEGLSVGKVSIRATSKSDSQVYDILEIEVLLPDGISLEVSKISSEIEVDQELQLNIKVIPANADQRLVYSSSNDDIARVDSYGKIKGIGVGEVIITIVLQSNPFINHEVKVKVIAKPVAITSLYVSGNWNDKSANDEILYKQMNLIYGVNAFSKITDAINIARDNEVIVVLSGIYEEEVEITHGINLTTLNSNYNPALDKRMFFSDSDTAVIINNNWYINNASDVNISGFTFTGQARIRQYGKTNKIGTKNFTFKNNYIFDTSKTKLTWQQSSYSPYGVSEKENTSMPGFLSLAQEGTWMYNTQIINNVFEKVSDTNILLVCASGAIITGNIFSNSDRDAIRLDYASLHGEFIISDNIFLDIQYNGIYVRTYSYPLSGIVLNIENNIFKNIGSASLTERPLSSNIGAISTSGFSELNNALFIIRFNKFINNYNYISLRANVTNTFEWENSDFEWKAVIEFNAFIDENNVEYYYKNLLNKDDSKETNVDNIIINHNFYGINELEIATISNDQFDHHLGKLSNLVIYNSLSELVEAANIYKKANGILPILPKE